jgi:hypothetical protein
VRQEQNGSLEIIALQPAYGGLQLTVTEYIQFKLFITLRSDAKLE